MIYLIRPVESQYNILLYLCSNKETTVVFDEISKLDVDEISKDDGIIAHDDDPFLLSQINAN